MTHQDPAVVISNPRLIAAIYFGLLSVLATIFTDQFFTLIGIKELIPVFEAILIGAVVAGTMGAFFGEQIIHCPAPYKKTTFFLGFIMVIASLPIFALGLVSFMIIENNTFMPITGLASMMYFYSVVLAYSYALFGFLLAICSGLAAIYLRHKLVYDILHRRRTSSIKVDRFPVQLVKKPHHKDTLTKKIT